MIVKLTWKRIVILCLLLAATFAIIAAVSAAVSVVITAHVLDGQWQEYVNGLESEHTAELGRQRLKWIERVWVIYYNGCNLLTKGQAKTCLQSARNGYVEGGHDNLIPAPGWDFYYVQFGRYLDSG